MSYLHRDNEDVYQTLFELNKFNIYYGLLSYQIIVSTLCHNSKTFVRQMF